MSFQLSLRSLNNLTKVHPDLIKVVVRAIQITSVDFIVGAGARSLDEQRRLVAEGKSQTMDSRHLIQSDGLAHAVDLWPWVDGAIPWQEWSAFRHVATAMMTAAAQLGVELRWGGDWDRDGYSTDHSFLDGPHFELVRA